MSTTEKYSSITRGQWEEALARQDAVAAARVEPNQCRQQQRYQIPGTARITYADASSPDGVAERFCAILEVSTGGLRVRSREEIPEYTPLEIELSLDADEFRLVRAVAHCTQSVGYFKVGIELAFKPD